MRGNLYHYPWMSKFGQEETECYKLPKKRVR
jgi:hypothetical protein